MSGERDRVAELGAENVWLREQLEVQQATIAELRARVEELEGRLQKSSENSSRPPSGDDAQVREGRAARRRAAREQRKTQRRAGGQPGAPGGHLARRADPDVVVAHVPDACGGCGADLDGAPVAGEVRRQVFDIPEPKVVVTDHVAQRRRCGCGRVTTAAFPAEAMAPACWGPRVRALAVYLLGRQHLPVGRCAELLAAVGAPVSTGWVADQVPRAARRLSGWLADLRRRLRSEPVVHADETSARVAGQLWWFHVASTPRLSLLSAHRRRGRAAIDDIGVLEGAAGTLVHDRLASYWSYGPDHALCGAHLLRDLAAVAETGGQQAWCDQMRTVLLDAKTACDTARAHGQTQLAAETRAQIETAYTTVVRAALAATATDTPPQGRHRRAANLAVAFYDYRDEILAYTRDLAVPFDNNQAERDLRMAKLQLKITGGWRSTPGIQAFANVRSYIDTTRKHGHNPLQALTQLLTTGPWPIPTT